MTTRLAAGPGGPTCLRRLRDQQRTNTTEAIIAACDRLSIDGLRPTIATTLQAGTGFKRTTLRRYKHILKQKQREFDDLAAQIGSANGHLETDLTSTDEPGMAEADTDLEPATITEESFDRASMVDLQTQLAAVTAALKRRDEQLVHALSVVARQRAKIGRLRQANRALNEEMEAANSDPLPRREAQDWDNIQ